MKWAGCVVQVPSMGQIRPHAPGLGPVLLDEALHCLPHPLVTELGTSCLHGALHCLPQFYATSLSSVLPPWGSKSHPLALYHLHCLPGILHPLPWLHPASLGLCPPAPNSLPPTALPWSFMPPAWGPALPLLGSMLQNWAPHCL